MKIKTKILFSVVLLSLFVNAIAMNLYITERKSDLLNTLHLKIKNTSEILQHTNSKFLYTLDNIFVKISLEYFFNDIDIVSIQLSESFNDKNPDLKYEEENYDKSKTIKRTTFLEYNDVKLGRITTFYTTDNIDKALSKSITRIVISFIIITVLISLALYILLNKFTKPITDLTKISSLIASGNLEKNVNVQSNDEIGVLSKSFEYMRVSLKQRKEKIETLNKELQSKVEKRTKDLSQQTKKITDLLNNVAQGFLSFDRNFLVDDEYSLECENLLGKELKNKDITKLLFDENSKEIFSFKENILDAFESDTELTSSLILSLLPGELIINRRAILLKYKIISDDKVMIILTNITDNKKLQNKIKKEQSIQKMIVTVVRDSSHFYETKEGFEEFCKDCTLYISSQISVEENIDILQAVIHSFKGLFAQLYMNDTAKKIHNIESEILKFAQRNKNNESLKIFLESFNLASCMDEDLKKISENLGKNFLEESSFIKIDENQINKLETKLMKHCLFYKNENKQCEEILFDLKKLKNKSLKYYLSIYPKMCQQLCLSLDKSIHPFEIIGDNSIFVPDTFKHFIDSLVHVFRNSCDHGIESRDERLNLDKNERGTISCEFNIIDNNLYIKITDDGRGINIEKLKSRIISKKLTTLERLNFMSKDEILNFIFNSNLSTTDSVTHISGRGIGLSSLKKQLQKLDATVKIETTENKGTTFVFILPLKS